MTTEWYFLDIIIFKLKFEFEFLCKRDILLTDFDMILAMIAPDSNDEFLKRNWVFVISSWA